jgi:hypothetical protein
VLRGVIAASNVTNVTAAPTPSTVRAPTTDATGPAIANPSGSSASEPIQSYELTRDSASAGMWRTSAVSHQISNSANVSPTLNASETTITNGCSVANARSCSGQLKISANPSISGRLGRHLMPISAPSTAPTPAIDSSTPNRSAPP